MRETQKSQNTTCSSKVYWYVTEFTR